LKYTIKEYDNVKLLRSENYNYNFDKNTGFFMRWGQTPQDDPDWCEFGPEIADIEISTICNGINGTPCSFCYKSNSGNGKNMSLEVFQKILRKLPKTVGQIAFGIGDIHANPDLYSIMEASRIHGIIPNVTINGWNLAGYDYHMLAKTCGAVAVSRYSPKDVCYDTVLKLSQKGLQQVNIHQLLCKQTIDQCFEVMRDSYNDPRLSGLNSIVFLALKQCGRGRGLDSVSLSQYKQIMVYALENGVRIGFDSCSAPMFMKVIDELMVEMPDLMPPDKYKMYTTLAEPCESTLFSVYIDVEGNMYPCSFCENKFEGISVVDCDDFVEDVWHNEKVNAWRQNLLKSSEGGLVSGIRECPEYKIWSD